MENKTLLIVDDAPENLAVMRQILSPDYHLVFATNGTDALAAARKHVPALILLDIQMPDISGYSVCSQLKADPLTEAIPVIFVTTRCDVVDETEGFSVGAADYITKPVSPPLLKARVRNQLSLVRATVLEKSYRDAVYMLGEAGHFNDTDTGDHIWRMAAYARTLAYAHGWNETDSDQLEQAAPMHDTGKIGIPQSILRKPGPLDEQEWKIMRTHSQIGHDILNKSQAPVFKIAAEVALRHHEKWDGSGYPDGLIGDHIPESARIVALADVFDALCMKRPYKDPWPIDKVVAHIQSGAGAHFDPALVTTFTKTLPRLIEIRSQWQSHED